MNIQQAIQAVIDNQSLSEADMQSVMQSMMTGKTTPAQMGGFLVGLRMKGETITEITAAAKVMRALATPVKVTAKHLVDTCGTGGDSSGSFNISTASAVVAAAAGCQVAKHGNRSVSSQSGSADVLQAMGVNLNLTAEQVAQSIESTGLGFLFAPNHHSAMKYAIAPRKEMKVRTIFNLLGPLSNPASAPYQVMGVYAKYLLQPLAEVLAQLGSQHVMVVHAQDGMDEMSLTATTDVAELKQGQIQQYTVNPEDFGFDKVDASALKVESVAESVAKIEAAFQAQDKPAMQIIALNAGAAIYVAGLAPDLATGVKTAWNRLEQGQAWDKLQQFIEFSQSV